MNDIASVYSSIERLRQKAVSKSKNTNQSKKKFEKTQNSLLQTNQSSQKNRVDSYQKKSKPEDKKRNENYSNHNGETRAHEFYQIGKTDNANEIRKMANNERNSEENSIVLKLKQGQDIQTKFSDNRFIGLNIDIKI